MRKIFFVTCAIIATNVYAIQYPSLEQVATKLYANYTVREMETSEKIQYEKKKDGWHVAYTVYNDTLKDYVVKQEQLYWSSASGKYKSLNMFPAGSTPYFSDRVSSDVSRANIYDYERCPYYGYNGWDQDIITDFASYSGTNDTIYEALARAYGNFASGYTKHHYAYHVRSQQDLPEKERVDLYIENEKKALAVYDGLRKRNPDFEVLIGAVTTKYFNEVMAMYDELMYYNRQTEVQGYFNEEFYDPVMIAIARSMLESCAQNGILFTNGDNDSYPLWYLQWIKGVRADVAVMNVSLMNTSYYLQRFSKGFLKVPPVKLTVESSYYEKESYFMRGDGSGKRKVSGDEFLTKQFYKETVKGEENLYFTPCKIVVHLPKTGYTQYDLLSEEDSAVIVMDRYYLLQGDMALIDIMLSNFESRPVYTAVSFTLPRYLEEYFYLEGMIRRFIPAKEKLNEAELRWMGPVGSTKLFRDNMLKLLAMDSTCRDRINGKRWETNIKLSAMYAAEMLVKSDKAGSKKVLDALYAFYPYSTGHLKPLDVYSITIYYDAGDTKSGDALGTAMLDFCERKLKELEANLPWDDEERGEQARVNSALNISKTAFDKNGRAALSARAQKIDDYY